MKERQGTWRGLGAESPAGSLLWVRESSTSSPLHPSPVLGGGPSSQRATGWGKTCASDFFLLYYYSITFPFFGTFGVESG